MRLGMHLRELWRLRLGLVVSAVVAAFAAVWSVADISLSPPGLKPRALDMATAFTQVVVDTPDSTVLDLRQGTNDIQSLNNRAVLLGTLIGSMPVRAYIAERAHLTVDQLQIITPRTPQEPRARTQPGVSQGPTDLLKATDQYRLDIQANPAVPLLDIYAQAPTAKASEDLANATVSGLSDYLSELAASESTPAAAKVAIRQLGTARGEVINHGVRLQVVAVVFVLVFALSCAALVVLARVRRGWQYAVASEA